MRPRLPVAAGQRLGKRLATLLAKRPGKRLTVDPRAAGVRRSGQGLAALVTMAGVLGGALLFGFGALRGWNGPLPEPPTVAAALLSPPSEVGLFRVPDRFIRGDSLSRVLTRNGFSSQEARDVARAVAPIQDLRELRTGQTVWMKRDAQGRPSAVELPLANLREVIVVRAADGWTARENGVETVLRRDIVRGTIEYSLYQSLVDAGERPDLAVLIGRALEYDIDFHRDSRRGDTFAAIVMKQYGPDGQWHDYGDLLAVRYVNRGRPIHAVRFEFPDGRSGYYDFDGNSIRRAFLMSPLEYGRLTSGFSHRRLHPIHRVYRPHYGVDYAAPTGTPVMATADGVVTDAGPRGPNGNMVTVRHTGGYETKYLHLSRIRVTPGQRVEQRDVVGLVGSTGTSTGPHVDYRLYRYGRPLNPRAQVLPPGPPIPEAFVPDFLAQRQRLLAALDGRPRPRREAPVARVAEE